MLALTGLGERACVRAYVRVAALMALPGYFLSVAFIDRIGRKRLQLIGFLMLTLLYTILAAAFDQLKSMPALLLIVYGTPL